MFRIAFTVRDKSLADTLTFLDGKAYDLEVRPIKGPSREANGGGADPHNPILSMPAQFSRAMLMETAGISGAQANYYLKRAVATRKIKRATRGHYVKV